MSCLMLFTVLGCLLSGSLQQDQVVHGNVRGRLKRGIPVTRIARTREGDQTASNFIRALLTGKHQKASVACERQPQPSSRRYIELREEEEPTMSDVRENIAEIKEEIDTLKYAVRSEEEEVKELEEKVQMKQEQEWPFYRRK